MVRKGTYALTGLVAVIGLLLLGGTEAQDARGAPSQVQRIVFSRMSQTEFAIWGIDPDGTGLVQLTAGHYDTEPAISPDGRKIAFSRMITAGHYQIFVMDSDGTDASNISNNAAVDHSPAWSPDGSRIAFSRSGATTDIWLMNADGSGQVQLTNRPTAVDFGPEWSPDGSTIVFGSGQVGATGSYVWTVPAAGGTPSEVPLSTPYITQGNAPSYSPDGSTIVFEANGSIYTVHDQGGTPTLRASGTHPRYSPDGASIVYSSQRDGQTHVYMLTGGNETQLTHDAALSDYYPDWGYYAGEPGDISGDGTVSSADVAAFLGYLAGAGDDPSGMPNGDLDCNSVYNARDVLVLLKYLAGITTGIGC